MIHEDVPTDLELAFVIPGLAGYRLRPGMLIRVTNTTEYILSADPKYADDLAFLGVVMTDTTTHKEADK